MNEGDVALTPLPQADAAIKNRPVFVLRKMPPFNDLLVCGISRQLHQEVPGFDDVIQAADADFAQSVLRLSSLIRLGFLAVLRESKFLGRIGAISPDRHQRLFLRLSR